MMKTQPFNPGILQVRSATAKTAGFTLIEALIVVVIISVLAAIAAPSWVTFLNRQRANAGRDQVFQALRAAQANSKRLQQSVGVQFNIPTDPEADLPTLTSRRDTQTLGAGSLKPGMASLDVVELGGGQLNGIAFANDGSVAGVPTFDAEGNVTDVGAELNLPVFITVSAPATDNPSRRCVIVETLLGTMRTAADEDCDPPT